MKTPEQLKGSIRSMAAKKNLRAQEVLQMFLFERILERLAASKYQNNFILKGGLLISSMIGISERTTMDMDTTVRGIQMEEDEIVAAVNEILAIDVGDGIAFEYKGIEPIREEDAYNNFRVHLRAKYGKIDSPMKIDVTTGDVITPAAIRYDFPMLFDDKTVPVMAYTKFGVVSTDVLPEVILKVLEAKRLIAQGVCRTSTEACKMADVSRSAYYKYKDSVYLHSEKISRRVVTYHFVLLDQAGVLSEVLTSLYKNKANVLTINQSMPIDSAATVTITVRFDEADADPEAVRELLEKTQGVAKVRILTTADTQHADE